MRFFENMEGSPFLASGGHRRESFYRIKVDDEREFSGDAPVCRQSDDNQMRTGTGSVRFPGRIRTTTYEKRGGARGEWFWGSREEMAGADGDAGATKQWG